MGHLTEIRSFKRGEMGSSRRPRGGLRLLGIVSLGLRELRGFSTSFFTLSSFFSTANWRFKSRFFASSNRSCFVTFRQSKSSVNRLRRFQSKAEEEKMENSSFEALTQDLQMEILSRLPLKSLGKFTLVSRKWTSLIRSKEFRKRYLSQSKRRPRVLFINYPFGRDMLFHSVYQQEEPLLVSGQQQMRTSSPPLFKVSQPIRGVICLQEDTKVVLCNPGAKKWKTLPPIQAREGASIRSFFGYHEAEDVFKVLCITQFGEGDGSEVTKEYQVYTEGSGEDSWTQIECKHDHSPVTEGLCKGGFLYYGARSSDKSVIMGFDVGSEDFTVIELPDDVEIAHRWKLVNYNKEIALLNDSDFDFGIVNENGNGVFEMWVRNETAGNWSRNCIEIPQWEEPVGNMEFFFKGTIGTGKLVFALDSVIEGSFFVLYYDTSTKNLRRFTIEGVAEDQLCEVRTFLDHVDSTWLM